MLILDLSMTPYWLKLPCGVELFVEPLTSARKAAADTAALKAYRVAEGGAADTPFEFLLRDAQAEAYADFVKDWRGIVGVNDEPMPFSKKRLGQLFSRYWQVRDEFLSHYPAELARWTAEGNGSAPSPNGSSAEAPPSAATATT